MGCTSSDLYTVTDTKYGSHEFTIMNYGNGRADSMLLSIGGIPYIWKRCENKKYKLQKLEDIILNDSNPKSIML